jgi:hypothetical protein
LKWELRDGSVKSLVQTRFQLHLHSFVIHKSGERAVVQQCMNEGYRLARRYHWHSAAVRDLVSDPHTAIVRKPQGTILNLVDSRANKAQHALLDIKHEPVQSSLDEIRKLVMPAHHDVRLKGSKFANMKELRFEAAGGEWRVAFAFDSPRKATLLVAGDKTGVSEKKFYKRLIARADARFQLRHQRLNKQEKQARGKL